MVGRKAGHHLGRAVRPFIHEDNDLAMKRLWAEALGEKNQGFVPEGEARQGERQRRAGVPHREVSETWWRQAAHCQRLRPTKALAVSVAHTNLDESKISPT